MQVNISSKAGVYRSESSVLLKIVFTDLYLRLVQIRGLTHLRL